MPAILFKYYIVFKANCGLFRKSYQNPTKNLVVISIAIDIEILDNAEKMNVNIKDRRNDLWRPHVSERKPHKCELQTKPRNAIEFRTPCCDVENFISHLADGPE